MQSSPESRADAEDAVAEQIRHYGWKTDEAVARDIGGGFDVQHHSRLCRRCPVRARIVVYDPIGASLRRTQFPGEVCCAGDRAMPLGQCAGLQKKSARLAGGRS
jgi:hypothetical protein